MKRKLKSMVLITFSLLLALTYSNSVFSQAQKKANKETKNWRYEIECFGIGTDGTYLIKVWSYSKKATIAIEQCKKNAVHGVIFKGFGGGGKGCVAQKPLTNNPNLEQEKVDFFDDFFADGGKFMKYVGVSGDGSVPVWDRMKIGKEYKIGVVVTVNKDYLRKDLEAAGIIKGLSSGF